jgi:hypothetical protein
MNRILRITTDRWVTGRAIRWAVEDARQMALRFDAGAARAFYTSAGTDFWTHDGHDGPGPAITITVERDNER